MPGYEKVSIVSRTSFRLTVVPPPLQGTASVLVAADGFQGPFLKGNGPIDLVCGQCLLVLAEALHPGQIENLVLRCPRCKSHNAIVSIPALENFVAQVQAVPGVAEKLAHLTAVLNDAHERNTPHSEVVILVEHAVPELTALRDLLVPKTPGDFYGLLAFVIGFLAWLQSRKSAKQKPSVVINNYFAAQDRFKGAKRNEACPCGSGKKFKKCHGP